MTYPFGGGLFDKSGEYSKNTYYNYYDIVNGTGYVIYYGACVDSGEYIVTTSRFEGEAISTEKETKSFGSYTKIFDIDFDLLFNTERSVKGKIISNIPVGVYSDDSAKYVYVVVKYYHYDGSTETLLATGTSTTRDFMSGGEIDDNQATSYFTCVGNVTTQRKFKKGEYLRFTVEVYLKSDDTNTWIGLGHCPTGEETGYTYISTDTEQGESNIWNEAVSGEREIERSVSQMEFHVPFLIEKD